MNFEIGFDFLYHLPSVSPLLVQPENGRPSRNFCTSDSQFDPVPDRSILDSSHAPNIPLFHVMFMDCLSLGVDDTYDSISGRLKSGRV